MKCIVLVALLCCFGLSYGQGISTQFLEENLLNPMLNSMLNNAVSLLNSQITSLFSGLFGGIDFDSIFGKIKEIYQQLFQVFLQIVNHAESWIQKADFARIEFVRAGDAAEEAVSRLNLGVEFLQPLVNLVQTHIHALISDFQGIIQQTIAAVAKPIN
ncbi:unnamed protein product [Rotaria socialis]|uniref:Uncharacterized protein n=1 Tax=Rotaria socialis TaxID=392032 RepID=A0A818UYW9_9BILA|nr:unnamed protein product [Rotaria socialis]